MVKLVIDPMTRIEGHLKVEVTIEGGVVKEARCSGMLFRGLEVILRGRDPRDAQRIMQRTCGVCPTAHATAAAMALDDAFGISNQIPVNGRLLRNLIFGANFIQSHILHFYHLAALDYVDVTSAAEYSGADARLRQVAKFIAEGSPAPFFPRYEGDYRLPEEMNRAAVSHYVEALDMRRIAQEMLAVFGGKMPHNVGIFTGGALEQVTVDKIVEFRWRLERLRDFIDHVYLPDVLAVAAEYPDYFQIGAGCKRYLTYGGWDLDNEADIAKRARLFPHGTLEASTMTHQPLSHSSVTEQIKYSWYANRSNLHPSLGETDVDPTKSQAYSFVKAPRYNGEVHEVGPLGRLLVAYVAGHDQVRRIIDSTLATLGAEIPALLSVLGRHAARAIECKLVADAMADWLLALLPGEPTCADFELPQTAFGVGLTAAPRGALGHWVEIQNGVIANYQAIVPTTWNCSPRDDADQPGACEQALEGSEVHDSSNPFEILRIVRSFDPCLACAIHMLKPSGIELGRFRVL